MYVLCCNTKPGHVSVGLLAALMQDERWCRVQACTVRASLKSRTPRHLLESICFSVNTDDKLPSLFHYSVCTGILQQPAWHRRNDSQPNVHCSLCIGIPIHTALNRTCTHSHPYALQSNCLTFLVLQDRAICLGQCERQGPGIHVHSGQYLGLGYTSGRSPNGALHRRPAQHPA